MAFSEYPNFTASALQCTGTLHLFEFWHKSLVQQTMNLDERLKDRQQQIVSVDRAGAVLKMNFCCGQRYTSQGNNLLNDYTACKDDARGIW